MQCYVVVGGGSGEGGVICLSRFCQECKLHRGLLMGSVVLILLMTGAKSAKIRVFDGVHVKGVGGYIKSTCSCM